MEPEPEMMIPRKIRINSGFSLLEALVSIAVFAIVMALIFSISNGFFKSWKKHDAKQDVNKEFVKIYSAISKDVNQSNMGYFASYNYNNGTGGEHIEDKRWFCFPASIDEGNKLQTDGDGRVIWTDIVIYCVIKPNDDCSSDLFCPHKKLVKTVYSFKSPSALNMINTPLDELVRKINTTLLLPNSQFPNISELSFTSSRTLSENILDLTVNCDKLKGKIEFNLEIVRLEDAKKAIKIGEYDFHTEEGRKFIESIEWQILLGDKK